jgi:hypothetical protein
LLRNENLAKKRYKFCQAVDVWPIGRFNQENKDLTTKSLKFCQELDNAKLIGKGSVVVNT